MKDIIDKIFDQVMDEVCDDPVRRFAELVAAAEREACAKVCDEWGEAASVELAAVIRARGDKHD